MKILLLTNVFPPDQLAGAALYGDLALFLKKKGYDVRVTTTFSYYPDWKLRPEDRGVWRRDELWQGIPLRRLWMHIPRRLSGLTRILSELSFLGSLLVGGKRKGWQPDVVVTMLPMLAQCLALRLTPSLWRARKMVIVQDFAVEAALELKILRIPLLAPFLRWLQRWALESADLLTSISPQMVQKLKDGIRAKIPVVLIPNWIHESLEQKIAVLQKNQPQREISELFYSGNLGIKQGLPEVVDTFAQIHQQVPSWRLTIHGGGADLTRLQSRIQNLSFIQTGPVLSEDDYVKKLLAVSACLIAQKEGVGANFLPSKLLPALASGTPVLAVCSQDSPLGQEVLEGGFGEVIPPGDSQALAEVLQRWLESPQTIAGLSQRASTRSARYRRSAILQRYEQEIAQMCTQSKRPV